MTSPYERMFELEKSVLMQKQMDIITQAARKYEALQNSTNFCELYSNNIRFDKSSLTDVEDQKKILEDMENVGILKEYDIKSVPTGLGSLFARVDNINCAYRWNKKECPQWFVAKYGSFFNK